MDENPYKSPVEAGSRRPTAPLLPWWFWPLAFVILFSVAQALAGLVTYFVDF